MQEEISRILEGRREEIERHVGAGLLTVTSVSVDRNLETAVVYYSWTAPLSDLADVPIVERDAIETAHPESVEGANGFGDKLQQILKILGSEISRELARRVRIRRLPKISFSYDNSLASADRVYRILNKLSQKE